MNLYVASSLDHVSKILAREKRNLTLSRNSLIGSSAWLIYVPKAVMKDEVAISLVFGDSVLRLDSFAFVLYEEGYCEKFNNYF